MTLATKQFGYKGENIAKKYLEKLGYKILEQNFTIRGGEIDIIALDQNILVFVEVKTRRNHKYGAPIEAISFFKLRSLQKTALFFIRKINWGEKPYRFDLVTVDYDGDTENIELIKNITF